MTDTEDLIARAEAENQLAYNADFGAACRTTVPNLIAAVRVILNDAKARGVV